MTAQFTPADEIEIRNLVSRYCLATDDGDADRFARRGLRPHTDHGSVARARTARRWTSSCRRTRRSQRPRT